MRSGNWRGATLALGLSCALAFAVSAPCRADLFHHTIPDLVPAVDVNTGGPYYAPPIPYGHYTGKNLGGKLGKIGGLLHGGVGGLFHKGACGQLRRQRVATPAAAGTAATAADSSTRQAGLRRRRRGCGGLRRRPRRRPGPCGGGACGDGGCGGGIVAARRGHGGPFHKCGSGCFGHASTIVPSGQGMPTPRPS